MISEFLGEYNCMTLYVGIGWPRLHKRIQFNNTIDCLGWREMKPRVKQIIKRVGETCTIVMCYTPIVLYVYSYVILDYMYSKADSNMTN